MGLTADSVGKGAAASAVIKRQEGEFLVALAGNPNVGKSTVFNALTGMKQHTGNWAGKTVSSAVGRFSHDGRKFLLADIPGTYSLAAQSAEEKAARDFICYEKTDAVIVVCDGTCLERNLNLVLQILEVTSNVLVCVNLMDEAARKNISVNTKRLSELLGVPVVGITARSGKGFGKFLTELVKIVENPIEQAFQPEYNEEIEKAVKALSEEISPCLEGKLSVRWAALRILENNTEAADRIFKYGDFRKSAEKAVSSLVTDGFSREIIADCIACQLVEKSEEIYGECVKTGKGGGSDLKIDRIVTSRIFGIPIMLGVLAVVFWLTAVGANYPSELLSKGLFYIGDRLDSFLEYINCHHVVRDMFINGIYRVLAWVVSVMLPPMAIFFPLFTLLEDVGYLPRAAFNLDRVFSRFGGCGKQALTMAMGMGCNAAGVTGCRIITSPRERLIAVLTNNFMPCNGRFPTLIFLITLFLGMAVGGENRGMSSLMLLGVILLGFLATILVSWVLSVTVLKGEKAPFVLELPPYRKPQIGKVIIRSVLDRTVFVLGRACAVAAPAGLFIWILANVGTEGGTILEHMSHFLEPVGGVLGMDGVILTGFILGFPANEIVMPIIIMCYMSGGAITETGDVMMRSILLDNGWSSVTVICVIIFTLMHFPCSTTCLTIRKETGSIKQTLAAMAIPTLLGAALCGLVNLIFG